MDRNEVEHVARVSGKRRRKTLLGLGIDATKPIETQRDFAHLRWWREIAEGVMKAAVIAAALGFGGTLATLVWLGFSFRFRRDHCGDGVGGLRNIRQSCRGRHPPSAFPP